MTFDFVVETPQRRGINRNNNKLIQRRATQAGAKTRLSLKSKPKVVSTHTTPSKPPTGLLPTAGDHPQQVVVANARLASFHNSPFLARFGQSGQLLYVQDPNLLAIEPSQDLPYPTSSVLQRVLLFRLAAQPVAIKDGNQLFKIVNLTQARFLAQLPSRYGKLAFLDDAIEHLFARLHAYLPLLKPNHGNPEETQPDYLYGKALKSLRAAIDNELEQRIAEIWFATMLLILSELLTVDGGPGWIWHAAGAARMLYKIGPEHIQTEFHRSLLASQVKVMVVETIISNKPCYLADPDWQLALSRTILDSDKSGDRSRICIELWSMGTKIPSLFQHVADHVHGCPRRQYDVVFDAVRKLLAKFNKWQKQWLSVLQASLEVSEPDCSVKHEATMALLAYYMLLILVCRLRIAMDPYNALNLEQQVLSSCTSMFQLQGEYMACGRSRSEHGSIYAQIASGTKQTVNSWQKQILYALPEVPLDADVFDEWCSAIGRKDKPASFPPTGLSPEVVH
ncbi:hypothetical protein H2198_009535 [Neophaeococcomyces mojaviensis]|uniref:Uncharacterized protein n=1 Tax=Neophaeococcomyces mojaviensis TaxID=3383035 RepID=A0ACC2ZU94_9EURO|nr:hypothetical protein H2198_009535 [Knufia sp. JES_112]